MRRSTATVILLLALTACGDDSATEPTLPDGCAAADGSSPQTRTFLEYPPICLDEGTEYTAVIETNHGTLHIDLLAGAAPLTVNSFVNLARFHYFDGTTCHRAIQYFVVQCGDPTATGTGGPGYTFADETAGQAAFRIGSVAMANSGPNTNGSQFFIITGDNGAALPPAYTLFGHVQDDDMAMVVTLDALGNPADGPPLEPIDIIRVTIEAR